MKRVPRLGRFVPVLVLVAFLVACAGTPVRRIAVNAFDNARMMLDAVNSNAQAFRASGIITPEQYAEVRALHAPAKDAWEKAKEAYELSLETQDAVVKDELLAKYGALMAKFRTLLYGLLELAKKYKVLSASEYLIYKNAM